MKKIHIKGAEEVEVHHNFGNDTRMVEAKGGENMEASDGYHTFTELYDHRTTLFITFCRFLANELYDEGAPHIWRSKLHSDGTGYDGWFIMGIGKEKGEQISYHLPLSRWEETNFAETLEKAPEWDGHTPADVLERLKKL